LAQIFIRKKLDFSEFLLYLYLRMKKFLVSLFTLITLSAFGQKQLLDKIVCNVGGETILLSEVEDQYSYMKSQKADAPANARCLILDNLMLNALLVNQSKVDSVLVADEEVESELNTRIDQILGQMNNDVNQFESYYGQTVAEVKDQFRDDLRSKKQSERMRAKITEGINVTPSEVQAFFLKIPKDSLPYFNSEVEISEIVVSPKVNDVQRKIAREKLEDIRKRIQGGENFATLAEKFSQDPGSGRVGGDLGWAKRGTFVPAFEATAYRLQARELSEVIESEFGFHLIEMLERRGNSIHTRHILIKSEITESDKERAKAKLDSVRNLLANGKMNFSRAVKDFSDKTAQSYHNDGRMVNPSSGNTFFETGDLDPDIYFATEAMKIGEYSKVIEFQTPFGESQYKVVKLNSRTNPHKANLKQDYNKIQQAALDMKKNKYTSDWLLKKVGNTYMFVDPAVQQDCPNVTKWTGKPKS
jgi:peptidyl-prolyl cis-trans isomerase SurA